MLDSIDSVLYMDTDTLLLRPVDDIWDHFKNFDSWQLASMTPEGEETSLTWYPRFARHPFAGKNGMNSGVMLLNLTRMRAFGWKEKIIEAYNKYKLSITWGDQDLINIVFHDHPGNGLVSFFEDYLFHTSSLMWRPLLQNLKIMQFIFTFSTEKLFQEITCAKHICFTISDNRSLNFLPPRAKLSPTLPQTMLFFVD